MTGEPAAAATDAALEAYFARVRARIPTFAARHFGLCGTLRLHAQALGLDLLRAPLNVLLVGPALFLRIAGWALRRLGAERLGGWLARRNIFLETRLARRIADLVLRELLELAPGTADGGPVRMPVWHEKARHLIAEYVSARHAVTELAAGTVAIAIGITVLKALTPSALSLGPLLAREMAQREAIETFWLGSWAGSLYYGWWPAHATWSETISTTLMVMCGFAAAANFMGLVTDPLQQALGLHRRRLERLVRTLERVARGDGKAGLDLPDPYVARLADLVDMALLAMRMTR